jgi:hypothetical protein
VQYTEATLGFDQNRVIANALLFAVVAVVGSLFEGLGSLIEVRWDKERESKHDVKENWYRYLSRQFDSEPVGYRYLSRLATTLYFELSMLFAVPLFLVGSGLLAALRFREYACAIVISSALAVVVLAVYFWWQARCTHEVLCETRREINRRIAS